jgi:serine/threonine protein kinase
MVLLMEKASEGPLYKYLHDARKALNWPLRIKIALDVARGMGELHSFRPPIVHRDLKSPNVLLCSTDLGGTVAKVSDFGTSLLLLNEALREESQATRTVSLPTWLAPEVIAGREYTEKSDVYAFGIIMWELLTRQHPFSEYQWMSEVKERKKR